MREFPSSICSGFARPPQKPVYRKGNMLDLVRSERRLRGKIAELEAKERQSPTAGSVNVALLFARGH